MEQAVPLMMVMLLGAYHGLNPAMGWLFAVALGLQERRRKAVIRALGPIALGHAASVALIVVVIAALGTFVPHAVVRYSSAAILFTFGLYKLLAPFSHPRFVGMRVNARDLTLWSFLMASAHGAGLMLIPLLLNDGNTEVAKAAEATHAEHHATAVVSSSWPITETVTVLLHTGSMLFMMAIVAIVIYEKLGLKILRHAWFNVDRIWALMLFVAAGMALVI